MMNGISSYKSSYGVSAYSRNLQEGNAQVSHGEKKNLKDEVGVVFEKSKDVPKATQPKVEDTPEYKNQVQTLANREREVIAHEQAHQSAGGEFTGSASYSYSVGPNGKRYISGGEVSISTPSTDDPEEAVRIMERVKQAALAPAKPSGQDLRVAASASAKQMKARSEIAAKRAEKAYGETAKIQESMKSMKSMKDNEGNKQPFDMVV